MVSKILTVFMIFLGRNGIKIIIFAWFYFHYVCIKILSQSFFLSLKMRKTTDMWQTFGGLNGYSKLLGHGNGMMMMGLQWWSAVVAVYVYLVGLSVVRCVSVCVCTFTFLFSSHHFCSWNDIDRLSEKNILRFS